VLDPCLGTIIGPGHFVVNKIILFQINWNLEPRPLGGHKHRAPETPHRAGNTTLSTLESTETTARDAASDEDLKLGLHGQRLGFRVRRLHHLLSQRVEQAFAPYGLRPGSLTTMVLISANPGYSQVELSRIGNLDKSAIVTIVDELEKRELAIRGRSSSDRRRNSLFLTAQGEKLMKEMHRLAMATEQPLREGLSVEEYDQLFELLEKARALVTAAT
jgi:DNA-binding MarR family transcriptional regulator